MVRQKIVLGEEHIFLSVLMPVCTLVLDINLVVRGELVSVAARATGTAANPLATES